MTKPQDMTAHKIAAAYRRGLVAHIEAGRMLLAVKASVPRGSFGAWIKSNETVLGFKWRTANLLMKAAKQNSQLTANELANMAPEQVRKTSAALWGNSEREPTKDSQDDDDLAPHQSYEWYTPPKYIAPVKQTFGGVIDLDPASCNEANSKFVKANQFYNRKMDGLKHPWHGRVYCNPPFQSKLLAPFVAKLIEERGNGNCTEAILLCPGATDLTWFDGIWQHASRICFTRGRVSYIPKGRDTETGYPRLSSVFAYFGPNADRFTAAFRDVGKVIATDDAS